MLSSCRSQKNAWRWIRSVGILCLFLCTRGLAARTPDEPAGDAVGIIDGDAIAVTGPMSVEAVRGVVRTILRSGAEVTVKFGNARISLVEGGQISICGPAHLSVLKSGAALTIAIDKGSVHFAVDQEPAITVYTTQVKAQPIAIGGGPQNALVGFDSAGALCIRTERGAMRLEQQFTGESVVVPQSADVLIANGRLDSIRAGSGRCSCELQLAKTAPPHAPGANSALAVNNSSDAAATNTDPTEAREKDQPIYQVFMPPLRYDANAKIQPEPDPALMIVVRRVHVRPTLIFRGHVEGESIAAAAAPPPRPPTPSRTPAAQQKPAAPTTFVDRLRNFVRKIWPSIV